MAQSFFLAVDVGTSRIAAATARLAPDGSIVATPFSLGRRGDSVATVAFVTDDGDLLFGDAAERRGVTQPERLVREFKRSIGDDVPLVVGGQAIRAEQLYARTVADVIATVAEREGGLPEGVILTHPAMWGPHRIGVVAAALESVGVGDVQFLTEPEAAARHYESSGALDEGQTLAVYDLGGGTFDCVILRKSAGSFHPVGQPVGLDDLGGADFDDAVLRHVLRSAEVPPEVLQDASPDARIALSQLRRECVDAKEALSFDSDVVIPVLVTAGRSSVRLTRGEFETMIEASVGQTIEALQDALESAGVQPDELESILLIGGSSRIPLVAQRLSEQLDRPIAIDADPKSSIALGAARTALIQSTDQVLGVPGELAIFDGLGAAALLGGPEGASAAPGAAAPVGPSATPAKSFSHLAALSGGAIVVAAAIVFGSTLTAGSGGPSFFSSSATPTRTPTPGTTEPVAPGTPETAPAEAAEQQPQSRTDSGAAPRSGARKGAVSAPVKRASDAAPTTRPSKAPQPVTAAPKPSTSPKPGGTTTTPTPTPTNPGGGTTTTPTPTPTGGGTTTNPGGGTTTNPGGGTTTDPGGGGTTNPGGGTTDPGTGTTDPGTGTTDPGTGTTDPGTGTGTDPGTGGGGTDPSPTPTPQETPAPSPPAPDPTPTSQPDIP